MYEIHTTVHIRVVFLTLNLDLKIMLDPDPDLISPDPQPCALTPKFIIDRISCCFFLYRDCVPTCKSAGFPLLDAYGGGGTLAVH
jgi:hypothetical protein